ncbi:MAG: response regulator transcription factor [Ktedonobacteraceae bacterium]
MNILDSDKSAEEESISVKLILIVEDDASIGDVIVQAIQTETPYQATLVTDGFQALRIVRNIKPQLFVLDYLLPSMNGLELYDNLHATEGLEHIPALFMSANAPTSELEKRRVYYIRKPFELDELLRGIEELLA